MCLAVPAKLVECDERVQRAVADLHGNRVQISTALVPEARIGDWVLVHAGFAIQRIDYEEAMDTWALLHDLQQAELAAHAEQEAGRAAGGSGASS